MIEATIPPIEDLLLHRGNMLMLDKVIAFENESIIAEYSPRHDEWYADSNGNMPAWIGLELMAQTVAAHVGLTKRNQNKPRKQGVLLGTRSYHSTVSNFMAAHTLRIHASRVYQDISGLGAFDCSIMLDDTALVTATLKVFEPEDFQEFTKGKIS